MTKVQQDESHSHNMTLIAQLFFLLQSTFGFRHKEAAHFNALKAVQALLAREEPALCCSTKNGEPRPVLIDSLDRLQLLLTAVQFQVTHEQECLIPRGMYYETFRRACCRERKQWGLDSTFNAERKYFAQQRYFELTSVYCVAWTAESDGDAQVAYMMSKLDISEEEARQSHNVALADIAQWLGHKDLRSVKYYLQ
ncbi:hypothetical protein [Vibrio sp. PNB22_1_1]|uniref:hypothetical protein n=1 Tax=unclassified Vibrio TaxID=2614977 RepID=UPI00406A3FFF